MLHSSLNAFRYTVNIGWWTFNAFRLTRDVQRALDCSPRPIQLRLQIQNHKMAVDFWLRKPLWAFNNFELYIQSVITTVVSNHIKCFFESFLSARQSQVSFFVALQSRIKLQEQINNHIDQDLTFFTVAWVIHKVVLYKHLKEFIRVRVKHSAERWREIVAKSIAFMMNWTEWVNSKNPYNLLILFWQVLLHTISFFGLFRLKGL